MLNWLRSFLRNIISNHQDSLHLNTQENMSGVLYFISSELSLKETIEAANVKIHLFQNLPAHKQQNKFPAYYLDLEQILIDIDTNNRFSKTSLRAHIRHHFPTVNEMEGCHIIFAPNYIQEVLLAKHFLIKTLQKGADSYRYGQDELLVATKEWLKTVPDAPQPTIPFHPDYDLPQKPNEWLTLLKSISRACFEQMINTFGKRHTVTAFEHGFKSTHDNYAALEAFPAVVKLMPAELMDEEKINALSKQQINNLLMHQLDELKELNNRLVAKNEELESVHQLLIASQRKTENTLHRLEDIVQSVEEGIVTIDASGKITMANNKVLEIWDYEIEDIIGQNIEILLPTRYTEKSEREWKNYLTNYKESLLKRNIRIEGQDKNGRLFPLEFSINEISSDNESYFTILLRDVTEELKREERLKQLNLKLLGQNLELMTKEQEVGAINTKLVQKNEQLEDTFLALSERNFELDQFVYRVSHDMRSPLSSLMGLINLIRIEKTPTQDSEYINMLEFQVHKLDTFLNSMLNFSKASRGQSQQEDISFDQLIDDCLAEFEGHPNYYRLMVNVNIENDGYNFINDYTRLKIIIRNLLSNAFEYLNPTSETPFLYIYVKIDESNCHIMFDDNGIGISKECMPKVFDMFYRATELSKGSGLGLYIVQQAIQKLQGEIDINSKEKRGTQIQIDIPNLTNSQLEDIEHRAEQQENGRERYRA